jgi:carbamoylphosphate synthase small subunit
MATQSGDDTKKPVALAKLHLEDGTTLIGKSFGSHESIEGEVCILSLYYQYIITDVKLLEET